MPMAKGVMSSGACNKTCTREPAEKDADGCPRQMCSPFSCCLKTFVLFHNGYEMALQPAPETVLKNNFAFRQMLISLKGFDIWNPPKFV